MHEQRLTDALQVTDARDKAPQRPVPQRAGTRIISVDNVLQYASEIPSAQRRTTPGARPAVHARTPSGRHPLDPKLAGRILPVTGSHIPARSSKVSEKLVLLPEASEAEEDEGKPDEGDEEAAPPTDAELARRRQPKFGDKSYAERLPKAKRTEKLSRVTAYCTAQSYRLRATAEFTRDQHGARTKLYDDCLYCVYQLPLLGGSDGYRVRSSPVLKNPGGRSVLDEQIEANERRDYREGWFDERDEYSVRGHDPSAPSDMRPSSKDGAFDDRRSSNSSFNGPATTTSDALTIAELFVFSYGVAVFWNFTENQEKDILADLTFSSSSSIPTKLSPLNQPLSSTTSLPLTSRPLSEDDFETEEFHFEYNSNIEKPRLFNDMITLRTRDHMIKLAMSHAISQSTKLSFFEERMQRTMSEAQYVPRRLALEGRLGLTRREVVALVGKLFQGRVDVNLCKFLCP